MIIRTTKLVALMLLVGVFALVALGQSPASAGLAPGVLGNPPSIALDSSAAVTGTVTITPTATVTPTATAVPPTATSIKVANTPTVTPTKALPTATKTVTPTVATATATKTVTPTVATATATKTATKTATPVARLGPRAAAGVVSALSTGFVVQNLDQAITATVTAEFYNTAGNIVGSVVRSPGPNQNTTIDQRYSGGGLDCGTACNSPWNGSVVLSSNTQIASIVNEVSGSTTVLGQDFRADAYNGVSNADANVSVKLPQILKGVYDGGMQKTLNSVIAIQNANIGASANVTVTYYNLAPAGTFYHKNISIPGGSSYFVDMQTETTTSPSPALPSYFRGSAAISSDQPIAAVVNQNAAGALWVYSGFADSNAATTLSVPFVMKNIGDSGFNFGTGIVVMTVDQTAINVSITYKNTKTGHTINDSQSLSGPSAVFDQRNDAALSGEPSLYGTATIVSNTSSKIVAMVNQVSDLDPRGMRAMAYRAFTGGTAKVFLPFLLKNVGDSSMNVSWGTGVAGQYLGTNPLGIKITITYYDAGTGNPMGTTQTQTLTPSNPMFVLDTRYDPNFTNSSTVRGSGVLTSPPGEPFVAIVDQVGGIGDLGDAAMTYSGINQ